VRYRRLGSSDLVVSELGLGSWLTLGRGIPRDTALALVDRALGLGVTLFDTAPVYDAGAAETLLGDALAGRARDSYVLATKLSAAMGRPARKHVAEQLEGSLRRLQADYIDLYQCHRFDHETPLEETLTALDEMVRQGKIRTLGFSEWTPEQIRASFYVPGVERFVASQPEYSILFRGPERGVIEACREHGISQLVWSPLAQGVLTGKYRVGERPARGTRADSSRMGLFIGRWLREDVLLAIDRLRPIAAGLGVTLAQLALAWVLREANVAAALVGATRPEQLDENAVASGLYLDAATLAAIDEAVADVVSSAR
jgi:aryl-alcohol dehydrogenase-like predicted oxidoreductase